jgi:hypothetical protein
MYLRNQALVGLWELVKSGTSAHPDGAPLRQTSRGYRRATRWGGRGVNSPHRAPGSMIARRGGPRPTKSPPSPTRGNGSYASWGDTGPRARRPAVSRTQSAIYAPPGAKRPT